MNKLKVSDKKNYNNNNSLTVHILFTQQNHPTFHSEERLINLERGRECLVGLSILFYEEMVPFSQQLFLVNSKQLRVLLQKDLKDYFVFEVIICKYYSY